MNESLVLAIYIGFGVYAVAWIATLLGTVSRRRKETTTDEH